MFIKVINAVISMISGSLISIFSVIAAILAIALALNIFRKVYEEDYKKPWLYIGIAAIFLGLSQVLRFLDGSFNIVIINSTVNEFIVFSFEFIAIATLTYGLFLEYVILRYFKGKFVKMKFLPVQEGTLGGELDINVNHGASYLAFKKEKNFMLEEFAKATKSGFEGFLITEENPRNVRTKYKIQRTPIAWINQFENAENSDFIKSSLDENSDTIEPIQLNNLISYVDNFLDQSQTPFIMIDLDLIFKLNNFVIVQEFLRYIAAKSQKFNGILICLVNTDVIKKSEVSELKSFLVELE